MSNLPFETTSVKELNPFEQKIKTELTKRFEASNFKKITINMKQDNAKLNITPCAQGIDIKKIEDVQYFLIDCDKFTMYGSDTIDELAHDIADYNKDKTIWLNSVKDCYKFYCENIKGKSIKKLDCTKPFSQYSDWHKSLFEYRPHDGKFNSRNYYDMNEAEAEKLTKTERKLPTENFTIDPHTYQESCEEYYEK